MFLLDRQRAIRGADAALREADLPLYADVVVALHRLQSAVDQLAEQWGKTPPNIQAQRAMHHALEAKEQIACFQQSPVAYERMRQQAEIELRRVLSVAKRQPPPASEPDDPFDFDF